MDLFIDSKSSTLAAFYLINYARVSGVNYVEISKNVQKYVQFPSLPCLISQDSCLINYEGILITLASKSSASKILLGQNNVESSQILQWVSQCQGIQGQLQDLNQELLNRVFLVTNHVTLADIVVYAWVQKLLLSLSDEEKFKYSNVVRWACHIQNLPGLSELIKSKVTRPNLTESYKSQFLKQLYGLEQPEEVKQEVSKKQQKKQQKDKQSEQSQQPQEQNEQVNQQKQPKEKKPKEQKIQTEPKEQKKQNEPKEEKKQEPKQQKQKEEQKDAKPKEAKKQQAKKAEPEEDRPPITRMDFRVGKIVKVWKHTTADKLYCEEIDIGGGEIRQIASGLVEHIPIEEMQDRMVIVITNLKARKLQGFNSHGMVMCANKDGKVEILNPPKDSQPGDKIFFPGFEMKPDAELNPKKKYFEAVQPQFKTGEDLVARFLESAFTTSKGVVTAPTIKSGTIS